MDSIKCELHVDENGVGYVSQRGLARLCGVNESSIRRSELLRQEIEVKAGQIQTTSGLKTAALIKDIDAQKVISYYAKKGYKEAIESMIIFASIGVRAWIQKELDWHPPTEKKLPQNYLEALEALVEVEKERIKLQEQKNAMTPRYLLGEQIETAENTISMMEFAGVINIGRNNLFKILREMEVIQQGATMPYRRFIDDGYFEVIEARKGKYTFSTPRVTPKGQTYLVKRLVDAGYIDTDDDGLV